MKPTVVVQGVSGIDDVPGLADLEEDAEIRFAASGNDLSSALRGAEVLLGWDFDHETLRKAWKHVDELRWIHWCAAGLDGALFAEVRESNITVTNARGVFDASMAEWVLAMILGFAKRIHQTHEEQSNKIWNPRDLGTISGKRALVIGAGSIGRAIGRQLRANSMEVEAIARSERVGDPDFGHVYSIEALHSRLPHADYVVLITPLTEATHELFGEAEFGAMAPHARFVNLGRGQCVAEDALIVALAEGRIAGAAMDVFVEEPLPDGSPLWSAPNCFIYPHNSSWFLEFESVVVQQFLENWRLFRAGEPLLNVVDKELGFVPSALS